MNIELIAEVAHEVNRAYCEAIGDATQVPWDLAPDWQRMSCVNGVQFHIANPDRTPEQTHENWLEEKRAAGWAWGPVKDSDKKEHPCFIEYHRLPVEQKVKDYLFRAVVHSLKDK